MALPEAVLTLASGSTVYVADQQWTRQEHVLYLEGQPVVPTAHEERIILNSHRAHRHVGVDRTVYLLERRYFFSLTQKQLKKKVSDLLLKCPCGKSKQSTARDRGLAGGMRIPFHPNTLLYVDCVDMPAYGGYNYCLIVVDAFTRYSQLYLCTKKIDSEGVAKLLVEEWVQHYNYPAAIHSDMDIRLKSPTCYYQQLFRAMGVHLQ